MGKKWDYGRVPGSRHGTMCCTVCGKQITEGRYRFRQKTKGGDWGYVSQHEACTPEDGTWAAMDEQSMALTAPTAALAARLKMLALDCVRAADMDTDAVLSAAQIDDMADAMNEAAEALAAQAPAAHCATCTCNPAMTPAIRFDASLAEKESAVREHLIRMGWMPPATPAADSEAVAWMVTYDKLAPFVTRYKGVAQTMARVRDGGKVTPLYTHPPAAATVDRTFFDRVRAVFNRINRRLEESNMPVGHALARSWESDLHRALCAAAPTPPAVDEFDTWWKSKKIDSEFPDMMDDRDFAKAVWDAALAAPAEGGLGEAVCVWTEQHDGEAWDGGCGAVWQFMHGGPTDNAMHYCPQCGNRVEIDSAGGAKCGCGLSTCVEPWEPGCGLGTSAEHAVAAGGAKGDRAAYEGAREDLLDWKGRAQRAERTLRGLGYTGIDASEAPQPAEGDGAVLAEAARYHYAQADNPRDQFGNTSNHKNPALEAWHTRCADAVTELQARCEAYNTINWGWIAHVLDWYAGNAPDSLHAASAAKQARLVRAAIDAIREAGGE